MIRTNMLFRVNKGKYLIRVPFCVALLCLFIDLTRQKSLEKRGIQEIQTNKILLIFSNKVHASNLQSSTVQCDGINTMKSVEIKMRTK